MKVGCHCAHNLPGHQQTMLGVGARDVQRADGLWQGA